jgi:hypothetical protein
VELLSAFQARDVGAGRLGIGFMHGGDGSGDEPVMATKQQVYDFANHVECSRAEIPCALPPLRLSRAVFQVINTAKG